MKNIQLILLLSLINLYSFAQEFSKEELTKDKVSEQTIIIEPYLALTNGAFFTSLSLVSDNPYVEYVNGFNFERGYRYQLRVKETIYAYPPEDASDRSYDLIQLKYKTKSYESFEMILLNELYLSEPKKESINKLKNGLYSYHNSMNFRVPPMLRAEFDRKMKDKVYCKGYFEFDKDGNIVLTKLK